MCQKLRGERVPASSRSMDKIKLLQVEILNPMLVVGFLRGRTERGEENVKCGHCERRASGGF